MGLGVLFSIMFAAPLPTLLKDQEPRIKSHTARVLPPVRDSDPVTCAARERKRAAAGKKRLRRRWRRRGARVGAS